MKDGRFAGRTAVLIFLAVCHAAAAAPPVHFLLDFDDVDDQRSRFATMGYLVVFNPGIREARATETFFFEDREPAARPVTVPPRRSLVESFRNWPVSPGSRFAIRFESSSELACQATIGWNNAGNDEKRTARALSPKGVREAAKSYTSQRGAGREWWVADGIQIENPRGTWIRESETALLLNPNREETVVTLEILAADGVSSREVRVPALRLRAVPMDAVVRKNVNYSVRLTSTLPIAAHWRRDLFWYDSEELMSFWSVPAVRPLGARP